MHARMHTLGGSILQALAARSHIAHNVIFVYAGRPSNSRTHTHRHTCMRPHAGSATETEAIVNS